MSENRRSLRLFVIGGLLVALGLAFFVSPLASSSPDGLEKVAQDQGFDSNAQDPALDESPLSGYGVEGVEDESLSKGLAGLIGVVITFGAGMILFGLIRLQRDRREDRGSPAHA